MDAELSSANQYRERKDDYSSWTVEARFDLNSKRVETVVTSVPLITPNRQINDNLSCVVYQPPDYQFNKFSADSSADELASMGSQTNFNSRSALEGSWMNFQKGHEVRSCRTHDQESETSSTTTTNTMSDSDQYFDFGIETPVDLDSAGEETVMSHELPIVINCEDGLPVRQTDGMESGFIYGSPILSGEDDSDQLEDREEEPSFYESLSQSPASATFAGKTNLDRFHFGHSCTHVCEPVLNLSSDVNTTDMEVSGHSGGVQVEEATPHSNTIGDCTQAQWNELVETSPHVKVARADLGFEGDLEDVESNDFSTGDMALSEPLQSEITHSSPPASLGSFVSTLLGQVPPSDSPSPEAREDACRFQTADVLADLLKLKLEMVRLDPIITDQLFNNVSADENDTVHRANNLSLELEKNLDHRYVVGDDNVVARTAALLTCVIDSDPKAEADDESNLTSSSSEVTSTKESTPSKEENEEQTDDKVDSKLYRSPVKRSTSLKTCKTPPGTPGRKKIVRFADALGLDLALVRTFLDEVPNVPQSAFSDLTDAPSQVDSCPIRTNQAQPGSYIRITRRDPSTNSSVTTFVSSPRILVANFTQPGNMPDFLERVKRQKISLETASMIDDSRLRGVVRVLNVDFHKSVLIRFTVDEWRTQSDQLATYVPNSCDGLSDRFTFNLAGAQSMQPGQRLIFAICYRVAGQEIWDSNQGRNYVFQCISNSNYLPSIALSNPTVSDAFLPYM
jgi:protein phosphatase 1 regulatory subunit 3A/B/C/D/E